MVAIGEKIRIHITESDIQNGKRGHGNAYCAIELAAIRKFQNDMIYANHHTFNVELSRGNIEHYEAADPKRMKKFTKENDSWDEGLANSGKRTSFTFKRIW